MGQKGQRMTVQTVTIHLSKEESELLRMVIARGLRPDVWSDQEREELLAIEDHIHFAETTAG